jgi:hypothetical protein
MKTYKTHTSGIIDRWTRFQGAILTVALLMVPVAVMSQAQLPVNLGSTAGFAVLAGSLVSNIPTSAITGNIGLSPAAGSNITGFGLTEVTGIIYAADATGPAGSVTAASMLTTAKKDLTIAYNDAAGRTPVPTDTFLNRGAGNIGGLTLAPGLYKFTDGVSITGSDVTLTGTATDVWIFQIASTFTVGNGIKVILAGNAKASNVFWQVGTSAALGTTSVVEGTILADQSISLNTGARLNGRALARIAAVTLASSIVSVPVAAVPVLATPANNATGVSITPTLTWGTISGASTYRVQVSTISTFATTIANDSTLTVGTKSLTGLVNNTTYYWRVNCKNTGGISAWTSMWSFKTLSTGTISVQSSYLPATLGHNGVLEFYQSNGVKVMAVAYDATATRTTMLKNASKTLARGFYMYRFHSADAKAEILGKLVN